jgi:hypothetical protein
MNSLGDATAAVKDDLLITKDVMASTLKEGTGNTEGVDAITDKFDSLTELTPELDASLENTTDLIENADTKTTSWGDVIEGAVTSVGAAAAQIGLLASALDGAYVAFTEGGTAAEKF